MSDTSNRIVQKLWSYCNVLRDDGLSYHDYLEQLTFLLFLKMSDERARLTGEDEAVPAGYRWTDLSAPKMEGARLEDHYRETLAVLGTEGGMLGLIFRKAQNRIQDPAKLRRLIVDLIDRESWMTMDADVKGDAYEGLLQKNAEDTKTGAGQYFTPRPLIRAVVEVMRPTPGMTELSGRSGQQPCRRWSSTVDCRCIDVRSDVGPRTTVGARSSKLDVA